MASPGEARPEASASCAEARGTIFRSMSGRPTAHGRHCPNASRMWECAFAEAWGDRRSDPVDRRRLMPLLRLPLPPCFAIGSGTARVLHRCRLDVPDMHDV